MFTEAGDSWSEEETVLQLTQQILVSAMMEDNSELETSLPVSTADLQQVCLKLCLMDFFFFLHLLRSELALVFKIKSIHTIGEVSWALL